MPAPPFAFSARRGATLQAHSLEAARRLVARRHLAMVGVRIEASVADAVPHLDYLWPRRGATTQWASLHQDIRRLLSATQRLLQRLWRPTQPRERQRRLGTRPPLTIGCLASGGRHHAFAPQPPVSRIAMAATLPRHVRHDAALSAYRAAGAPTPALPAMQRLLQRLLQRLPDAAPMTRQAQTPHAPETVAVRSGHHRRSRLARLPSDRGIAPTTSSPARRSAMRVAAAMQAPGMSISMSTAAPRDGMHASGSTPALRGVLLRIAAADCAATSDGFANRMQAHAGNALQRTSRTATTAFASARTPADQTSQTPSQTLSPLAPPAARDAAAAVRIVAKPAKPRSGTAADVGWLATKPTTPAAPRRPALPRSASTARPPLGPPWPEHASLGIRLPERMPRTPAKAHTDPMPQTRAVPIAHRASHAAYALPTAPSASGAEIATPAAALSVSIHAPAQALQRYAASAAQALAYRQPSAPSAAQWAHDAKRIEHSVQTQVVRELLQQRHGHSLQAAVANALVSPHTVKLLVRHVQAALARSDRVERYRKAAR